MTVKYIKKKKQRREKRWKKKTVQVLFTPYFNHFVYNILSLTYTAKISYLKPLPNFPFPLFFLNIIHHSESSPFLSEELKRKFLKTCHPFLYIHHSDHCHSFLNIHHSESSSICHSLCYFPKQPSICFPIFK
jgi:hypothetical protein